MKAGKIISFLHKKKRWGLIVLAVLVFIAAAWLCHYLVRYQFYHAYKAYLSENVYEEGTPFRALADASKDVAGMELAAESKSLKLYANVKTGEVAVYDKRNGQTVYSNPPDADQDSVANKVNLNYLKSQLILQYYNSDVVSGTMDSYSVSVSKKRLTAEKLKDGIRFVYTMGDTAENAIHFEVPLEYRLKDDYLEATVPAGQVKEYNGSIYRIQLLRYFGAASTKESGYTVVPNGCGSLIYFNNGKTQESAYSQYVYELDPLVSNYTTIENVIPAKLPLFALCREKSSVLGTIESGASLSLISADVAGKFNDYNYAYATFVVRNADNLRMFGDNTQDVYVLEKEPYNVDCTVRYSFLTEENKGYVGVGTYYRNRLLGEGSLKATPDSGDIPFYCDVIAGIKETSHFLGVQYLHSFAMTTYDEAKEMSKELTEAGISKQVMNLQGWFNGGYYHDAADVVHPLRVLGSKKDLRQLSELLREKGGRLYLDVQFQKVSFADNGFPYNMEASRYYSGYVVSFGAVDPTTLRNTANLGYKEIRYNLLSPKYLPRYVKKFAKQIRKYDVDGISLRDLGNVLASDKRRTNIIDREQALSVVKGQFEELKKTGKSLMTNAANAYAFAYSDDVINAPVSANQYRITDADVPLYGMILHGSVSYAGELMNFEDKDRLSTALLELIESGASPHFVFTREESSEMKNTAMNSFYCTTFDNWKEEAAFVYEKVNEVLREVNGAKMQNHEILDNGLRRITYDNGKVIRVNYSAEALSDGGITVPAKSYHLEGTR